MGKLTNMHKLICKNSKCFLEQNGGDTEMTMVDLCQEITKYLKNNKKKEPKLEILYELWKMETDQNPKLTHKMRKFNI